MVPKYLFAAPPSVIYKSHITPLCRSVKQAQDPIKTPKPMLFYDMLVEGILLVKYEVREASILLTLVTIGRTVYKSFL
jgi:hypothetical protein